MGKGVKSPSTQPAAFFSPIGGLAGGLIPSQGRGRRGTGQHLNAGRPERGKLTQRRPRAGHGQLDL
jgi:hypothetical protein